MPIKIPQCRLVYRQYFPFWDKLTDVQKESLCADTTEYSFPKGTDITSSTDICIGAVMMISGTLRAFIQSENGKEITLYRFKPGEVCMLSASCVLQSITFDVMLECEEDCSVYIVNGETMSRVASENLYVANYALDNAVKRFSDVVWVMQQILFMSLDKRIAVFLWDEMVRNDSLTLNLTHEQIAKNISSAREAVSRMLKYFQTDGIVELSRKGIRITDKDKLRKMVSESY